MLPAGSFEKSTAKPGERNRRRTYDNWKGHPFKMCIRDRFSRRSVPASEVARQILDQNGLYQESIQRVAGNLTDHYDPRTNVVSLSDSVYDSPSVASIGIAAHEVGHAIPVSYTHLKQFYESDV